MDHPAGVHVGQCRGQLPAQLDDGGHRQRTAVDPLGQRLPVDQLHDEEDAVAVDAGVVEPRQAGVAQADQGGQLGLVLRAVSGGQRDLVQLDRHVPAGVPVERAVHGGRTAPAEHVTEFVALADAVPGHDLLHGATSPVPTPTHFSADHGTVKPIPDGRSR
jgi:hypothetical protein